LQPPAYQIMAGRAMNSARFLVPILLLAAAACGSGPAAEPPLAGARIGGPFTLTDQDGRQVSDAAFAGKYRIVYFGYTYCPDVCPVDVQNISAGLKAFEAKDAARGRRVVPVFITVDPERDTQAVLKQYVSAFHPRLVGLTGSAEAIGKVAKSYAIYHAKRQTPGHDGYLVDHSRQAYLMDPEGKPMALLPADQSADAVAAELDRWVK
jgi:protein SCO1/2